MNVRGVVNMIWWGVFCASSWTWCIGMYMPRILIDRFGWPGFIAFAVPNVLGCAAFGYVIKSRQHSENLIKSHGVAMSAFSIITVAFHVFFLGYLASVFNEAGSETAGMAFILPVIAFILAIALSRIPGNTFWLTLAGLGYLFSLTVFGGIGTGGLGLIKWSGEVSSANLIFLTPIFTFGFLLCPYFDLTFHRAIQQSTSRHSFAIFGIAFAVMLVLTCAVWFDIQSLRNIAVGHLVWQSVITMSLHLRELKDVNCIRNKSTRLVCMLLPIVALIAVVLINVIDTSVAFGESIYIRFFIFYGLVFPAYFIVFMLSASKPLSKRRLLYYLVVMLFLMPLFELGFIHEQFYLLSFPVLIALYWILIRPRTELISAQKTPD